MNVVDDKQRFGQAFAKLNLIFPSKTPASEEQNRINVYWSALRPYSIDQVEGAMTHIANTQKESFFPTPGRIQDVIKDKFPNKPEPLVIEVDNTPVNNTGSAYMLYCVARGKEWDWNEYEIFKTDYAAGRVRVERRDAQVNKPGRPNLAGGTVVTWERSRCLKTLSE